MDIDVRAARPDEADQVFAICSEAFASPPQRREPWMAGKRMEDFLGAWMGDELLATTEVIPAGQFFCGRSVPMGAVASVAVRPDHRGRGLAPRLLTTAIEQMRERGLVISTLHPATTRFYRDLGWEIAGEFGVRRVPTQSLAALPRGEPECMRPGRAGDHGGVRECYDRAARTASGAVDRTDQWWAMRLGELERPHRYLYVYEVEGRIKGYAVYDQQQTAAPWGFALTVDELIATDARAEVTLWRHLGSHSAQVESVTVLAMPLDVLTLLVPEQVIKLVDANHWMTRIIDAVGAIAARGYPNGVRAEVHLQITDRLAPWNDGRFVLDVAGGQGTLRPGGTGDVRVAVNALASLYTSWASARTLASAGLIHHGGEADLAMLDAVFSGPRPCLFDEF